MFFKKKQDFDVEEAQPTQSATLTNPTYGPPENEKDNYGDEDQHEEFLDTAGKVGKAQHSYFKQLEKISQGAGNLSISISELQLHKTAESAWLSLNGTVYDVTSYLKYHPGGRLILQGCGKECSDLFNKYHPWVNGQFLLKKYKLGYLSG